VQAVILAGGQGVRLKPYTITLPKPLVPVGEEPIMKLLLKSLKRQGIKEVVICVNHMKELIEAYFGDGSALGMNISYSRETKPLGTVAPIKLIQELPDDFLVMNGDIMTDLSLRKLFYEHKTNDAIMTVATYKRNVHIDYGVIKYDANHIVTGFIEKPYYDVNVSMGIYAFNKRIFDYVPDNTYFGFDSLMHKLLQNGEKVKTFEHHGYWLDIGRPEDYEKANEDVARVMGQVIPKAQ
jgi:NDP-sugar pyrophosphorylase family protein